MICAWNKLLDILPMWLRKEADLIGKDSLQELRMRINAPPEFVLHTGSQWGRRTVTNEDISFSINMVSQYSPWAASTLSQGYLTASGGHRIGVCGEVVCNHGSVTGIRNVRSVCIRIARDYPGIATDISKKSKSILILGSPGWGKTTLLRDLIRQIGVTEIVSVIDERGELFPMQFDVGKRVDIMTGCRKAIGIEMLLRTMGPDRIALDEITSQEDADAVIHAVGCGVGILATAHASSKEDMLRRQIYRKIWDAGIFESMIFLHPDKSYHEERTLI